MTNWQFHIEALFHRSPFPCPCAGSCLAPWRLKSMATLWRWFVRTVSPRRSSTPSITVRLSVFSLFIEFDGRLPFNMVFTSIDIRARHVYFCIFPNTPTHSLQHITSSLARHMSAAAGDTRHACRTRSSLRSHHLI